MHKFKFVIAFCGALVVGAAMSAPAAAAPMMDPFAGAPSESTAAQNAEKARIVCNAWGRCWRTRPRFYVAPFYRPVYRARPRVVCNAWGRCWRRW